VEESDVDHSFSEPTMDVPLPRAQAALSPTNVLTTLHVNGVKHTLNVEPRATLAEILRGPLGLTGTKIACNRGACSACTIWLDKAPVCACMILAVEAYGRDIVTIEGLSKNGELHEVQKAFIAHDALQCGFCTPGLVMSVAALLTRNPSPTQDEVTTAVSGHICRCGTYPKVIQAALAAAKSSTP